MMSVNVPRVVKDWLTNNQLSPASVYSRPEQVVCVFPRSSVTLTLNNNHISKVRYSPDILPYV